MRSPPSIVILAAGRSSRMRGRDKLLEEIDGTPLILRATRAACATSDEVIVILPRADRTRRAWLGDTSARVVDVDEVAMSASIRAGIGACRGPAAMLHLADMPEIDADAMWRLSRAWQAASTPILQATDADGSPGQPVIFDAALFPDLLALTGDRGAKPLLARFAVTPIALPGKAATTDLDTPEAWAAWRRTRIS